jgi:dTDP-4-amino-4,6-dideoxygalactose transaminase
VRQLRVHGAYPKYFHHQIGTNSRLDGIQAAILRVKLRYLDKWTARRREIAKRYNEGFGGLTSVQTPVVDPRAHSVWNQYTIRILEGSRDELKASMGEKGIPTGIYYPLSLHLQPCFEYLGQPQGSLPVAEMLTEQVLSLPVDPEMTGEQQDRVIEAIRAGQPA